MRSLQTYTSGVILALVLAAFVSCTPGSCIEETNAFLKASFYLNQTGIPRPPDSLTLYGLGMDTSKIYNKAVKVQPALLPLNADTLSCSFVIRIEGISDTIRFWYSTYPHLVSLECGYTFYHMLADSLAFSNNIIDTIIIRKSTITTLNEENIRIFY